jgi:hypothetical protein
MDDILNSLPQMNKGTAEDKNAPASSPPAPQPKMPEPPRDFFSPPRKKEPSARFSALREALNQTLMPEGVGEDMLHRQMQMLDGIFHDTIHAYAHCPYGDENSAAQTHRLNFALRLQNQCLRTARSLGAMSYMSALNDYNAQNVAVPSRPPAQGTIERHGDLQTSPPPAPVLDEQKEDGA